MSQRWLEVSLGTAIRGIQAGNSFKCDERPPAEGEIGVAKVSAVSWGRYQEQESKTCLDPARVLPDLFIRAGDFLLSRANTIELVGACVIAEHVSKPIMLSDKILRIDFDGAEPRWVMHFLRSHFGRKQIEELSTGNQLSMRNIGQAALREIRLPLPPLNEQRRIVTKLEDLLARSRRAKEALDAVPPLLEKLRQSILAAAFRGDLTADWRAKNPNVEPAEELLKRIRIERRKKWEEAELAKLRAKGKTPTDDRWKAKYSEPEPVDTSELPELPKGWRWASVDELITHITSGSRAWSPFYDRGVSTFIMAQNVNPWRLDLSFRQSVDPPAKDPERDRTRVARDDLLITIVGANTGDTCLVDGDLTEHFVCQSVALVRPVISTLSWLLLAWTNATPGGAALIRELAYGQGRPHLSLDQIRELPVPVCGSHELNEIERACARLFERLTKIQTAHAAISESLRGLAPAILAQAFRGELVEQDPNDEPASAMLERLAADRHAAQQTPTTAKRSLRQKARA